MTLSNSIISNNNCTPRYAICRNILVISNNFFNSSIKIFNISNNIWCLNNKWCFKHLWRSNTMHVLFIYELFLPGHELVSYLDHPSHRLANNKPWNDLYFGNASRNQDCYMQLSNWKQSHLLQPSFHQI